MEMLEVVEYKWFHENVICKNKVIEQLANIILIEVAHRERKRKSIMCIGRILDVEELIEIANSNKVGCVLSLLTRGIV